MLKGVYTLYRFALSFPITRFSDHTPRDNLVGAVGDGGVVEADAALAVGVALVAKGVLHGGNRAGGGAGEVVGAHGQRDVTVAVNLVVLEGNLGEALAGVDGEAAILGVAARDRVAADEVGHRLARGRAELVLRRLGGLEEHVGVTVAVELAGAGARQADVVAALEVRLRDVADGLRPEVLARDDVLPGHVTRRRRRRAAAVGDGGVVEADAALAVGVALVAKGVLHGGNRAGGGAGEVVGAHGQRDVTVAVNLVVLEGNLGEALAGVDGEAAILGVAARDRVAADEVGHRLARGRAELVLRRLGGLEEHVHVAVAVEFAGAGSREADVVLASEERRGDVDDGAGPEVLARADLGLGDLAGARGGVEVRHELAGVRGVHVAGGALVGVGVVLVRVVSHAVRGADHTLGLGRGGPGAAGVPAVGVGGSRSAPARGGGVPGGGGLRGRGGREGLLRGRGRGPARATALVSVGVRLVVVVKDELLLPGRLVGAVRRIFSGVLGPARSAHTSVGDNLEGAPLGGLEPAGDRLDGERRGDGLHVVLGG
mmetsp:Transcript_6324/g.28585  ORF Transcript_6324/g.28585 Transcript_6324/m.28585 type:complete len:543 (-) Transcript_6324:50-1678(-)